MKTFFKVFLISFVCFTLIIGAGTLAFFKFYEPEPVGNMGLDNGVEVIPSPLPEDKNAEEKSDLERIIEKSKRVNVLLLGMEGPRTDTIIFASFDPESKGLDMVSIPRDTFFHSQGYDQADQKKINAVHGRSGVNGTIAVASHVLAGVPIHEYIKVSYSGVENIVDSLGGVKVNIPFDMNYDDPYDKPPLSIHFKKGTHVLNGKEAIKFVRFRKNNDGTGYPDGDIGRIRAQQQFLMAAADKILSFRLPVIANTVFKYVKTSMELEDIVYYAKNAIGMTKEDIKTYQLPGRSVNQALSYYIHDPQETKNLIKSIYERGLNQ